MVGSIPLQSPSNQFPSRRHDPLPGLCHVPPHMLDRFDLWNLICSTLALPSCLFATRQERCLPSVRIRVCDAAPVLKKPLSHSSSLLFSSSHDLHRISPFLRLAPSLLHLAGFTQHPIFNFNIMSTEGHLKPTSSRPHGNRLSLSSTSTSSPLPYRMLTYVTLRQWPEL